MKEIFRKSFQITIFSLLLVPVCLSAQGHDFELSKNLETFHYIVHELDFFYVDSIDPQKVIGAGIDAMLSEIDPYTQFFPESDQNDLKMMTTGKYAGIGAIIRQYPDREWICIEEPYEGMPAARYGLRAGDMILRIDGESMKGKASSYVSDKLRGESDTKVQVTVRRPGVEDSIDLDVVRSVIALPAVPYYGMWEGHGYIQLNQFTENCSREVMAALVNLKEQGAKGIILDLRGNGGGLLNEAINIVGMFVPRGTMVLETRGRIPQSERTYKTERNPIDVDIPLVVLTDGQSASASEIVAGALQDLDRAVIVGSSTFGKGLVQSTRPLPYNGVLKVTTAKYYIPSGRCIQEIDYSRRNEKGEAEHIPDSLKHQFYTAAGRPVREGGGIIPDVICKMDTMPDILYSLSQDVVLFDYSNEYCLKHDTIAPMDVFEFTDDDYESFKEFVCNSEFEFTSSSSRGLTTLRRIAQIEGLADKASAEFDALAIKLEYDLRKDLDIFRDDIKRLVGMDIATRYYYQRGGVIQSMGGDKILSEAVSLLDDGERYNSLLAAPANSKE